MTHHWSQLQGEPSKHPVSVLYSVSAQPASGPKPPVVVPKLEPVEVPVVAEPIPVPLVFPFVETLLAPTDVEAWPVEAPTLVPEPEVAVAVVVLPVVLEGEPDVAPASGESPVAEKQPVWATTKSAPAKIQRS